LQSVQEHSAKGVRRRTWRGVPSGAPPQELGVKPRVFDGKEFQPDAFCLWISLVPEFDYYLAVYSF
jgi:hypothetical protein